MMCGIMSESNSYDLARQVVYMNARKLAKYDADTLPLFQALQFLRDASVSLDTYEVLHHWAEGPNTHVIFMGLDKDDFDDLSDLMRKALVNEWIAHYIYHMTVFLSARLDTKEKDDS